MEPLEISCSSLSILEHALANRCAPTQQLAYQRAIVDLFESPSQSGLGTLHVAYVLSELFERIECLFVDMGGE